MHPSIHPIREPGRAGIAISLFLLALTCVEAASPRSQMGSDAGYETGFRAERVHRAPVIDGVLDEWSGPPQVTRMHQLDPGEFAPPSEPTEIWVAYDSENLYIGARMHDSDPGSIVANNLLQQQRVTPDDRLTIILDTFHDRRNGYFFEVNPHGQRGDGLLENNNRLLVDWDGIWQAAATMDEGGWTAEIAIPFKTLSFDPGADTWGINFFRHLAGRSEYLAWSSQGRQDWSIAPRFAGTMSGLSGLEQGVGLDVVPSLTLARERDLTTGAEDLRWEPSVDAFYKLTPGLTGVLTLNTDFSATEVDDRRVNLDRFSLFFPEKRDFFLQDAGIFEFGGLDTNGRPFFSRTIGLDSNGEFVDILGGLKLAGRVGDWSLGTLAMRQDRLGDLDADTLFVSRAKYNLGDGAYVGGIATSGDPQSNADGRTLGVDARLQADLNGTDAQVEAEAWVQRSQREAFDSGESAWGGRLRLPNDRFFFDLKHAHIGENFDPAMGFVNRPGVDDTTLFLRYRHRPSDHPWIRATNHWIWGRYVAGPDGRVQSRSLNFSPGSIFTHDRDFLEFFYSDRREVVDQAFGLFGRIPIPAGDYRFHRLGIYGELGSQRDLSGDYFFNVGSFFDGERRAIGVNLNWRPGPHFAMSPGVSFNDVSTPRGDFITRLLTLRTNVAFDARWAWITLMQFDNVSGELGVNTRLRWIPEAGQEYFLVLDHGAVDEADGFRSIRSDTVLKLSYTFRF